MIIRKSHSTPNYYHLPNRHRLICLFILLFAQSLINFAPKGILLNHRLDHVILPLKNLPRASILLEKNTESLTWTHINQQGPFSLSNHISFSFNSSTIPASLLPQTLRKLVPPTHNTPTRVISTQSSSSSLTTSSSEKAPWSPKSKENPIIFFHATLLFLFITVITITVYLFLCLLNVYLPIRSSLLQGRGV